jgi:ADP-ribose pyrophosphatase
MREKTISSTTVFDGRVLRLDVLDVELESGRRSRREIVRHPGAAVVLPQLPDGRFVLVRQFRKPLDRYLVEAVAGTLEKGEDPRTCALREVREETGHDAEMLRELGVIYPAPGYCDESLHAYYARVSGDPGNLDTDEDETIEVVYAPADRVEAMIDAGEIRDSKTLAIWLLHGRREAE